MKLRQSKDYVYIDDGHFSIGIRLEWGMVFEIEWGRTIKIQYDDGDVRKIHFKNAQMANRAFDTLCDAWDKEM